MADGVFNVAKGKFAYYASQPDGLVVVLFVADPIADDTTMKRFDTLAEITAGDSTECSFTNYERKYFPSPTVVVDDVYDEVDISGVDTVWESAGGAFDQDIGKFVVCYIPDVDTSTDDDIIPLTFHDFVVTTNGTDLAATVGSPGIFATAQ